MRSYVAQLLELLCCQGVLKAESKLNTQYIFGGIKCSDAFL